MRHGKQNSQKGFTLIASLLITVMLSGVAAGLLYLVFDETKMGGNDLEANLAFYGAESGMEKMASDLGALYQQTQVPTAVQIQALTLNPPTNAMVGDITYPASLYTINYLNQSGQVVGAPAPFTNNITSGPNSGLYALVTELQLGVTAERPSGATVSMTRNIEVAEIPVFQFGVFCGYDCSYFAGPNFSFGGRVHTNMNMFLATGADLVFNDRVQAFKQVITDRLENGYLTNSGSYPGTIYVPDASSGCALGVFPPTGATCKALPGPGSVPGDASWSGGYPSTNACNGCGGSANSNFPGISTGTFNTYLANAKTGVTNLQLPFVTNSCVSNQPPCTDPITIIRKPLVNEVASSVLGTERLYNKAQIRILIADDPKDLHPERGTAPLAGEVPAQDIQLPSNTAWNTAPFTNAGGQPVVTLTAGGTESIGFATAGSKGWVQPYSDTGSTAASWGSTWPLTEAFVVNNATPAATTGPWIRVEYCNTTICNSAADFVGVTTEWLQLGFGRQFNTQITSATPNLVDPNAILILQQLQPTLAQSTQAQAQAAGHGAGTMGNWYPINFYDVREGEMRDNPVNNVSFSPAAGKPGNPDTFAYSSCAINGIMNAVELDVGNLNKWLKGSIGASGTKVNYTNNNGYVLYFSDHRGMRQDPYQSNGGQTPANVYSGESGLEDVVNSAVSLTATPPMPDGALELTSYYNYSPEDVDQNNQLDNWGEQNLGYGYGINSNINPKSPYTRVGVTAGATYTTYTDCASYNTTTGAWLTGNNDQEGMADVVSGARHVLKLVDGALGNVPTEPASSGCINTAANPTACGGFTVASENPVYIQGNYNSSSADTFWGGGAQVSHSAASVIADSVTVLSNQWNDANSLMFSTAVGNRTTNTDAYYRTAVAGGKNIPFPQPGFANVSKDFGTDGGMHNFLRYLETWNNTLHYNGSLVSMYYAEYDTGIFKCCTVVYSPPTRDYYFDTLFLNPANLPPATPMIQDIVNLSYHQNFTAQQTY